MKLLFNGKEHYTDFDRGYDVYRARTKSRVVISNVMYRRIVRMYCRMLAGRLEEDGIVDLPCDLGTLSASVITRKAQYRGKKFIGYGGYDRNTGILDGKLKTFGIVFMPKHTRKGSLRCYGFVANRRLFRRMKDLYGRFECPWTAIDFYDEMI